MSREAIEEAIEVLEDASAEMLTETGNENYYGEAIAVLRQALETEQEPVALPCVYITSQKDGGNCYGDGTVYRGQRSKDSSVTTYTAKLKEKNHG